MKHSLNDFLKSLKITPQRGKKKSFIKLNLEIKGRVYFKYSIETSPDLDKYFKNKQQHVKIIHGDEKIANIPKSILILPVITNFIPLAWYFDAELIVDELDETFYNCLDNIKQSYKKMYPLAKFKGKITANKLVNNSYEPSDTYISLFSQGVDSLYTVCENLDKKLHLVSVYGSDIPLNKKEGWKKLSNTITEFSNSLNLETTFIETSFKFCLDQSILSDEIKNVASSSWWHQFQHGLVLLGHSAIIAYVHKAKGILISSSHSPKESEFFKTDIMQCASSPIIDNEFKFASCDVTHFGYEAERFEKIEAVANYSKKHNIPITMRVCYTSLKGGNCSLCDKCSRCIMSLIALKENPEDYGFKITDETFMKIHENFKYIETGNKNYKKGWNILGVKVFDWVVIQENFNKDRQYWQDNPDINWFLDYDFEKIKKIRYD